MSRGQPSPLGMICMQDGNRVVGWAVLEHDYEATIAKSHWIALVRDLAVVKQLGPIGGREVFALIRETHCRTHAVHARAQGIGQSQPRFSFGQSSTRLRGSGIPSPLQREARQRTSLD